MPESTSAEILIVEDSPTQAAELQYILEQYGYGVMTARNGSEALEALGRTRPTLVVSDIIMPEMDGFELCREIKRETDSEIPVILLTSLSQPEDVIKAVQCGADQFVTKPYDEKHLLATIEHLCRNSDKRERKESAEGFFISYRGEDYLITSPRQQILNLLLSTYETAVAKNTALIEAQEALQALNRDLETTISKRTAALRIEVEERKAAQTALQVKNEELNALSQQLWQTAKLATVGELVASIAHELNNPLSTVSLRIESLLERTEADELQRRELTIIEQEIGRMSGLIANLLQFSRRGRQQISTVDLGEEIEKTLELVYYHLRKYNIAGVREFPREALKIHADRQQLRQLFLNLFVNAADAMPRGGTLTTRLTAAPGGETVRIEIIDTGLGIPPECMSKVMEPFYTTKPEGKGTGLGLAICRRIVREHQGKLEIISEGVPGKGTRVCITLPVGLKNGVDYLDE